MSTAAEHSLLTDKLVPEGAKNVLSNSSLARQLGLPDERGREGAAEKAILERFYAAREDDEGKGWQGSIFERPTRSFPSSVHTSQLSPLTASCQYRVCHWRRLISGRLTMPGAPRLATSRCRSRS